MTERKDAGVNPANQTDEKKGQIKKDQVTENNMQRKDMAQGSEPATRAASHNRS